MEIVPVKIKICPDSREYKIILLREFEDQERDFRDFSDAGWELIEPVTWYRNYGQKDANGKVADCTEGHAIARRIKK